MNIQKLQFDFLNEITLATGTSGIRRLADSWQGFARPLLLAPQSVPRAAPAIEVVVII